MSAWDDDDFDTTFSAAPAAAHAAAPAAPAPAPAAAKAGDDWEAMADRPLPPVAGAGKPLTRLEQSVKARNEADRLSEAVRRLREQSIDLDVDDKLLADKLRKLELQKQADLDSARDLFGDMSVSDDALLEQAKQLLAESARGGGKAAGAPAAAKAKKKLESELDFMKLGERYGSELNLHREHKHFARMMKSFSECLVRDMRTDDIKALAQMLTALQGQRFKEERDAARGPKKLFHSRKATENDMGLDDFLAGEEDARKADLEDGFM